MIRSYVLGLICSTPLFCLAQAIPSVDSVRQADAICATCHQGIYRRYLRTPMANASGIAIERPITGEFDHPSSGVSYRVSLEQGSLWLTYRSQERKELAGQRRLEYFLGSGHLGTTYIYTLNNYSLESPIAYYTHLKAFDMKPGLEYSPVMPAALPLSSECMRCHMSGVRAADKGTINRYTGSPFLHGGITCESCHGDSRDHVANGGKSPIINPSKLNSDRRDSICISCHLEGDTMINRRGRSIAEYKPGDRIEDYVTYFAFRGADFSDKGVSEVEEFGLSRCKRVSGGAMSCTTCHDPHGDPSPEERVSYYRAKCLSCHSQKQYATEHYFKTPDCTTCHMPASKAQNIQHVAWTDHRIRKSPSVGKAVNPSRDRADLAPLLSDDASLRDRALAYYSVVVEGKLSDIERAWRGLLVIQGSDADDPAVLVALGRLAQLKRDRAAAMGYYRTALQKDPLNLVANNNLGALLAESGDLSAAVPLWESSFRLNEDIESLGLNLALADCKLGRKTDSQYVLNRVLTYSPDSKVAQRRLAAIESGQERCGALSDSNSSPSP